MSVSIESARKGENRAQIFLWLLHQPGENTIMAAVSDGREVVCSYVVLCYIYCYGCSVSQKRSLQFLWVLVSSSILLACTLPTLGSVNSMGSANSKTNGSVNRTKSNIPHTPASLHRSQPCHGKGTHKTQ